MTAQTPNPSTATDLTDAELRALIYFGIGVGSEGNLGGRDISNQLTFCGTIRNGVMDPVGNSGFSIGTLQTDLGADPAVARSLVGAYQAWARANHPDWVMTAAVEAQTTADLARNGRAIEAQHGRQMDATQKSRIDQFLASADGITYVHGNDIAQTDRLMRNIVTPLQETSLYRNASIDDKARLVTVIAKAYNQGETWGRRILDHSSDTYRGADKCNSLDDVKQAVKDLPDGRDEYMRSGRDEALKGAEVFIGLRNSDARSPLRTVWNGTLANPMANPAQLAAASQPHFADQYVTTKNLFLNKESAPRLIEALDRGSTYGHDVVNARGQHRVQSRSLYAAGNDFVVMDGSGIGKSYVGGAWGDVDRNDLIRAAHDDGAVDLNVRRNGAIEPLLHVDPRAAALRPVRTATTDTPAPVVPEAARPAAPAQGASPAHAPDARSMPLDRRGASLLDAIQRQLPAGTSLDQAAHVVARAHENGIRDVSQLDRVAVMDGHAWVVGRTPGFLAKVDLSAPVPPLQESLCALESNAQETPRMTQDPLRMSGPAMG